MERQARCHKLNFHLLSLRVLEESSPQAYSLDSVPTEDPWVRNSECNLERVSNDSFLLTSRDPDGASVNEELPAVREDNADLVETKADNLMTSSEDINLKDARGGKRKKSSLFTCLVPARLSFRKNSERANQSKSDATKLVKEI